MNHILVVDDEAEIRSSLEEILREEGYGVASAPDADEAMVLLRDTPYDVVLLDIWLPGRDGLEVLAEIRDLSPEIRPEVVIISGHGTIEAAVKATKLGAYDFLEKPLSLERTLIAVKNAVEARRLRTQNEEFKRQFSAAAVLTGESVPLKALRQQIKLMAPTNGRVLIYGESGTGKELIARSIHAESLRRDGVFVELNCAAIPEAHIESELFGYRHGAQPGGPPEQRGTLERADGGTLYLDEVGDMSLKTQAKVLSALDDQLFTPVGGTQPCASTCASSPPPTRILRKKLPKATSVRISFTASMLCRSLCRRYANASRIFRSWRGSFSSNLAASTAVRALKSAKRLWTLWRNITGPATCASSGTSSSAFSSSTPECCASSASICPPSVTKQAPARPRSSPACSRRATPTSANIFSRRLKRLTTTSAMPLNCWAWNAVIFIAR